MYFESGQGRISQSISTGSKNTFNRKQSILNYILCAFQEIYFGYLQIVSSIKALVSKTSKQFISLINPGT